MGIGGDKLRGRRRRRTIELWWQVVLIGVIGGDWGADKVAQMRFEGKFRAKTR